MAPLPPLPPAPQPPVEPGAPGDPVPPGEPPAPVEPVAPVVPVWPVIVLLLNRYPRLSFVGPRLPSASAGVLVLLDETAAFTRTVTSVIMPDEMLPAAAAAL